MHNTFRKKSTYLLIGIGCIALSLVNTASLEFSSYGMALNFLSLFATLGFTHFFLKKLTAHVEFQNSFFKLCLVGVGFLAFLVLHLLLSHLTGHNENQNTIISYIKNEPIEPLLLFIVQASIIEEMLYRVALFDPFSSKNKVVAILFSSFLFALAHTPEVLGNFLLYFFMGVVLRLVRLYGGVKTSCVFRVSIRRTVFIWSFSPSFLLLYIPLKGKLVKWSTHPTCPLI